MFDAGKYTAVETFTTTKKLNLLSVMLLLPLYVVCIVVYLINYDYANIFVTLFKSTFLLEIIILGVGVLVFLCVSLLIKAAVLSVFAANGFNSVKFKIIQETQKPYCCLTEPVKIRHYQFALTVYILIMGIAPYIIAIASGDFIFILASLVCLYFTGSDILLLAVLSGEKNGSYIIDFDGIMLYRIYREIAE